jgi:hypothetical protein
MSNYTETYKKLFGNALISLTTDEFTWNEPVYDKIQWGNEVVPAINIPTKAQVEAKIVELQNIEPFKILRKKRNELLKECDYLALPDYPHENPEIRTAWKIYRQQLRDLPNNNESIKDMKLDDNDYDNLIGVVWPTPPS